MTWYQHAVAYAAMKWPSLAAHSRASLAEALATVTPALTGPEPGRPSATALQTALYRYAFNPARAALGRGDRAGLGLDREDVAAGHPAR